MCAGASFQVRGTTWKSRTKTSSGSLNPRMGTPSCLTKSAATYRAAWDVAASITMAALSSRVRLCRRDETINRLDVPDKTCASRDPYAYRERYAAGRVGRQRTDR